MTDRELMQKVLSFLRTRRMGAESLIVALQERLAQPEQDVPEASCGNMGQWEDKWEDIPDAFNEWWDADYDDTGNPYRKDSPAYWAWSGWKAASKQPECSHHFVRDEEAVKHYCCQKCGAVKVEQPEQVPVPGVVMRYGFPTLLPDRDIKPTDARLYTTPPKRPWVDLTDEELDLIDKDIDARVPLKQGKRLFARAVLAKAKEKNT